MYSWPDVAGKGILKNCPSQWHPIQAKTAVRRVFYKYGLNPFWQPSIRACSCSNRVLCNGPRF